MQVYIREQLQRPIIKFARIKLMETKRGWTPWCCHKDKSVTRYMFLNETTFLSWGTNHPLLLTCLKCMLPSTIRREYQARKIQSIKQSILERAPRVIQKMQLIPSFGQMGAFLQQSSRHLEVKSNKSQIILCGKVVRLRNDPHFRIYLIIMMYNLKQH